LWSALLKTSLYEVYLHQTRAFFQPASKCCSLANPICSIWQLSFKRQLKTFKCLMLSGFNHRLNGSSSPVLMVTSLSYGEAKNSTPTESKPLNWLR